MLKLPTLLRSTLSSVMLSLLLAAGSGCKDSSQSQGVGWQPNVPFGTLPPGFDSFPERWNKQINDRLAREEGLAVLWATHLIDEVRADDHIALLHQGRLLASGVAGELTAQAECDSLAQWFDRQTGKEDSACRWP